MRRMYTDKKIIALIEEHSGGEGGVSKAYVDARDAATLQAAKAYTDENIPSVEGLATTDYVDGEISRVEAEIPDVSGKLDKVTEAADTGRVYCVSQTGYQYVRPISMTDAIARAIPIWNDNLNIPVGTPTDNAHAANKQYVDNATAGKLDKVDTTDQYRRAYCVASTGAQVMTPISAGVVGDSICRRNDIGQTSVAAPTGDLHAANKKYVDDQVSNTEVWTFTLADGTTVNKTVILK